ncbi:MAG: serine hydrolase [Candidatus Eisenbacteria sp.]|nr:serine hydrolase [Candidatus Eisenbacteria bacterium]
MPPIAGRSTIARLVAVALIVGLTAITLAVFLGGASFAPTMALAGARSSLAGHCEGAIELPGQQLEIDIDLSHEAGGWIGDISIPAQGAQDLPLKDLEFSADRIGFTISGIPGDPTFNGTLNENGTRIVDPATQARAALEDLEAIIAAALDDWQTPGLAVGVVADGQAVLSRGYGHRNRTDKLTVTARTLFAIGSCTKAFTAFTMATLVDEGLLDWDRPVAEYLPGFQMYDEYATAHITPRDLVTHRAGLPRHDLVWYNNETMSRAEVVRRLRYLQPNYDLRERWQYNNLMYLTAGYLIEQLTGKSWEEAVRERVFMPLGMERSNFSVEVSQAVDDFALPYLEKDDELREIAFRPITMMGPAGSINSCAEEMTNWLIVNLGNGRFGDRQLLPASTIKELHTPQMVMPVTPDAPEDSPMSYALGWMTSTWRGHYRVQHGGNIDGFSALVTLFPNDGVGIVTLTNKNVDGLIGPLTKTIADRVLELEPRDWIAEAAEKRDQAKAFVMEGEEQKDLFRKKKTKPSRPLQAFVGEYEHPGYGIVEIRKEGKGLEMILNGMHMPLEHWHYDVFSVAESDEEVIPEDLRAVFVADADGNLSRLSMALEQRVDPIVFERLPDKRLKDPSFLQQLVGDYEVPGQIITISLRGSVLKIQVGGQPAMALEPRGSEEFVLESNRTVTIRFALEEGNPASAMIISQPGGVFTAERVSEQ